MKGWTTWESFGWWSGVCAYLWVRQMRGYGQRARRWDCLLRTGSDQRAGKALNHEEPLGGGCVD